MTGVEINIAAQSEENILWRDMTSESQVIYALLREAMEQAGYDVTMMDVELITCLEGSTLRCKVELRCNRSCSHCHASTDGSGC